MYILIPLKFFESLSKYLQCSVTFWLLDCFFQFNTVLVHIQTLSYMMFEIELVSSSCQDHWKGIGWRISVCEVVKDGKSLQMVLNYSYSLGYLGPAAEFFP